MQNENFADLWDLAQVLTDDYNGFASMSETMPLLSTNWVREKLEQVFSGEDLEFLLEDEFGRGVIMGQLRVLFELHVNEEGGELA